MSEASSPAVTEIIAAFAADFRVADIPRDVMARAQSLVIDFAGNVVRAGHEAESTPAIEAMLARLMLDGPGPCSVFGRERRYTPAVAALLNGALGHSLDFDDTHADSSLHPSAPVVPAALAAGQMVGASGREMLAAIIVGYEICCRLGNALDPTSHYARGFHPTATAGVFGAAAAAGRLFGLDAAQMASAFGVAGSQAAGSLQFLANGGWNKRYQVGAAAMNGLVAATLAAEEFVGASAAIEGQHGLLVGYSDNGRPERAVVGLGAEWETLRIGLKPYPSCRYTHAAIDGLLAILAERNWHAGDIGAIRIGLHRNGITLTGAPLAEKRRPTSIVDGQFSMPFTAAVALHRRGFGWDDYDLLGDPVVEAIAGRIEVFADARLEGLRHPFGASLAVSRDGETIERIIADPSGEPETFPDAEAIRSKFEALAGPVLGAGAEALFAALSRLESLGDVRSLAQ
jgi:2-methylcitrate dehydratase PrpD